MPASAGPALHAPPATALTAAPLHSSTQALSQNKCAVMSSKDTACSMGYIIKRKKGSPKRIKFRFIRASYSLHQCDRVPLRVWEALEASAIRPPVVNHTPTCTALCFSHSRTDSESNNCLECLKTLPVVTPSHSESCPGAHKMANNGCLWGKENML